MPATNNQAALAAARELFEKTFGEVSSNAKVLAVHAPGRSEISGNHTDHEGGHVIAGALDVAVDGVAVANGTNVVRIIDANFPLVEVDLSDLSVREDERETTAALVRGMAFELAQTGRTPAGFDFAYLLRSRRRRSFQLGCGRGRVRPRHGGAVGGSLHRPRRAGQDEPVCREPLLWQALRPYGPGRRLPGRARLHGLRGSQRAQDR